jgi:hypothetical protein
MKISLIPKIALAAALAAGALSIPAPSQAAFGSGCGGSGTLCPDVYAPVICSNGHVYSNSCEASKACATGCVPYADVM